MARQKADERPIVIRWSIDESLSERAQAVQIGMGLLLASRTTSMAELTELLSAGGAPAERLKASLNLWRGDPADTPTHMLHIDRFGLLDEYGTTLSGIQRPAGRSHRFNTGIMECQECRRWGFVSRETAPAKCPWTRHCNGGVLKIDVSDTEIAVA